MRRLLSWLRSSPRDLAALAGFVAVSVGLWWERPSLALIVPGTAIVAACTVAHFRGGK